MFCTSHLFCMFLIDTKFYTHNWVWHYRSKKWMRTWENTKDNTINKQTSVLIGSDVAGESSVHITT